MTVPVATKEKVKAAVVRIEQRQQDVTLDLLREEVGGGSRGTLIKLLAEVRSEAKQMVEDAEKLSADTRRAALEMAVAISRSERALAQENSSIERQQHLETVAKMVIDAQRAGDLQDATDEKLERVAARLEELEMELAAKKREYDELWGQFVQANSVIETLERQLKDAETARPSDLKLEELATLMRGLSKRFEPAE